MKKPIVVSAMLLLLAAGSAMAAESNDPGTGINQAGATPQVKQSSGLITCRDQKLQYFRPTNQCGINVFETTKDEPAPFTGFQIEWGAGFVQPFQSLKHSNNPTPSTPANQLIQMGPGFNNASANLYLHAQMAPGVRVQLANYMSSRHHNDFWVKDGYLQVDELPVNAGPLNALWKKFVTVKIGHMEINYGDTHFRRTDNGMGIYNPFVGNYLLDAFTTEIGVEVYLQSNGIMAMAGITGGQVRGSVSEPKFRNPTYLAKIGFDRQINPDLRVRVTGSMYLNNKSPALTLYAGDRAGSPYFCVVESSTATCPSEAVATSGTINPGFNFKVKAFQLNPFVKYRGLELFGVIETADGASRTGLVVESTTRTWNQYAFDAVYRFAGDKLFAGVRYNYAEGELVLSGVRTFVDADRFQVGGGWFIMPYLLMKAEFVNQNYYGFPASDIRRGANFHGVIGHAVLAF